MKNDNENKELSEVDEIVEKVIEIEMQYDVYCKMMKEMFLAGSTNN